jgi:glucose/arabinose dehydrogenase
MSLGACSSGGGSNPAADGGHADASVADGPVGQEVGATQDAAEEDATTADAPVLVDGAPPLPGMFCALPGSVYWTAQGPGVVPGSDAATPDLTWLTLPPGFCAHYFATVGNARQLRFAPGGELFVASPTSTTTGGNTLGAVSGIVVLPDDDHDGVADSNLVFARSLPSIQGLLFANGLLYYQDGSTIRSVAYHSGDRAPSGPAQVVTQFTSQVATQDGLHWPKAMDIAMDGTIYIANGGSQSDQCLSTWPDRGAIFSLQTGGGLTLVTKGFRNPIALRCETDHNVCLAAELVLDYTAGAGGREKLVPVRAGDNWGFPCCATKDLPYNGARYADDGSAPDCSGIPPETDSFVVNHTPFGLDFETGRWPTPWKGRVFITLHGAFGSWAGARVVSIALDTNGLPLPGTDLPGDAGENSLLEFASGWDDGQRDHGRPAPVTFAPDGRMFLGDDNAGLIVWIAPIDLPKKAP